VSRRFRVKSPNVMHETIEGEVIVIDLNTGSYYSLREAGAEIWHGVERGMDEAGIVNSLERGYDGPREEIVAAVGRLLDELASEDLIEAAVDGAAAPAEPAAALQQANGRVPFVAPVFEKHSDMQDLILLDPVHQVGPQGWPQPEPGARD
jgi:Coenzyme PQQ synthesis protein D (PqqD)